MPGDIAHQEGDDDHDRNDGGYCGWCVVIIELLLVATVRGNLTRVDAYDDSIDFGNDLDVLGDDLESDAGVDGVVGDCNGVDAMPVRELIAATCRMRVHVRGDQSDPILKLLRRRQQGVIALVLALQGRSADCLLLGADASEGEVLLLLDVA